MSGPQTVDGGVLVPLGVTAGGLPYPTPQDVLADTAGFIQQLAQAIDHRLDNRSLLISNASLTTNASGDMTITFPAFTTLNGLVIQPFTNWSAGADSMWVLVPRITGLPGNTATVHVDYLGTKTAGPTLGPFGGSMQYNVFAWGVPR